MLKFQDVAITYQTTYRVLGSIALIFSLMALPAMIYGDVTAQVVTTIFFLVVATPSSCRCGIR